MSKKNISRTKAKPLPKKSDLKKTGNKTVTLSWDEAMRLAGKINPHQMDYMDDDALTQRALRDKNNPPASEADFTSGKLVPIPRLIKAARRKMGLDQIAFAARFHLAVGTLRDWEQGRRFPDGPALAYLKVIAKDPAHIASLLKT